MFKQTKGFTLIETLIAVAVLMIAVAGPLSISSKALVTALYARDQSAASYLAQEEMELIKNRKDNNMQDSGIFIDPYMSPCTTSYCDLDLVPNLTTSCSKSGLLGCPLYISSDGTYTHNNSSGTSTVFRRYFTLSKVTNNDPRPPSLHEYEVTVYVLWNTGSVVNAVILHGELSRAS